jgi:hypothetical protein
MNKLTRFFSFTFDLFGFDFHLDEKLFGFWIASLEHNIENKRTFLGVYYSMGSWFIDVLWVKVVPFEPHLIGRIQEWWEFRKEEKIEKEMNDGNENQ